MTQPTLKPPVLVQDQESLESLILELQNEDRIGIDTESNSLYAYREQVCLVQISTVSRDYLVDPLAEMDLSVLGGVLADPGIEKILHGAEYDVICLRRDFDFQINNLFDTRVACRTLGWEKTGLGDILAKKFNVKVNKRFQRANWGKRPLPEEQLHYARMDTHFLIPLRDILAQDLVDRGRWDEAYEENQRLSRIPAADNGFDPDGFWGISHATRLSGRGLAILRELYLLRDQYARRLDRPPFKVMGNKTLLQIAGSSPGSLRDLQNIHGMTSGQIHRYGEDIIRAVHKGRSAAIPVRPRTPRADDAVVNRYKCLMDWRKERARLRRIDSDVVLSKDIVWQIASEVPHDLEGLKRIMPDLPRRVSLYGEEILEELRNCYTPGRKKRR